MFAVQSNDVDNRQIDIVKICKPCLPRQGIEKCAKIELDKLNEKPNIVPRLDVVLIRRLDHAEGLNGNWSK